MGADAENEMERIHRGLEDFLEQEIKNTKRERGQKEPKLFTIEDPRKEKEIDVIGSAGKKSRVKVETYYLEDWDSEDVRPGGSGRGSRRPAGSHADSGGNVRPGGSGRGSRRPAGSHAGSGGNVRPGGSGRGSRRPAGSHADSGGNVRPGGSGRGSRRPAGSHADSGGNVRPRRTADKKGKSPGDKASHKEGGRRGGSRGKRPFRSRLKRFLVAAVLILALLGAGLYQVVGMVYHKMNYVEISSQTKLPMQQEGAVNILLIGNDSRQNGEDGRSDAMILLSVSRRTRKIYMISLLRDIYVEIPGHDNNRLNAAYSFGGAELLMETVEKNFDIPVHRYVQVNFEAFANLLDAVGGVDLELSREEIEYVNGYLVEYNMLTNRPQGTDNMDPEASGLVHLNGPQALAYCRNRYLGTDFGRTERQRKVMAEVMKKLPRAVLTNFGELTDGLLPNLTTNLTQFECFRLSLMAGKLLTYELVSDSIPQPGTYKSSTIRKMSVLEVDFEANRNYLKEKIYGK